MKNEANFQKFGIVGAGAWGTALTTVLKRAGRDVILWAHETEVAQDINNNHENGVFLPGIKLDKAIEATNSVKDLSGCDALMLVVPVQHMRSICSNLSKSGIKADAPIIVCSKGIEQGTLKLPGQIVEETVPQHPLAVLSGPNFAMEIAKNQMAATTLACADTEIGRGLAHAINNQCFRPYWSNDIIGAQIGGALKNVIAIACGIVMGREMGDNARAAIITRGLNEMTRLGLALEGRDETFRGLSGNGDLILTCTSEKSRNTSLGIKIGRGEKPLEILASRKSVAEGFHTSAAACNLAKKMGTDMPIVEAVDAILNKGADIDRIIGLLLARDLKREHPVNE